MDFGRYRGAGKLIESWSQGFLGRCFGRLSTGSGNDIDDLTNFPTYKQTFTVWVDGNEAGCLKFEKII